MDLDEDVGPKLNSTTLDSNSTWSVGYDARHIHIADGPEQGENGVTIGSKNDSANLPIRRRAPIACRRFVSAVPCLIFPCSVFRNAGVCLRACVRE